MTQRAKLLENARMMLGSGLMELRLHDEQRCRIVTRIERAYAQILRVVGPSAFDDPQLVVDET